MMMETNEISCNRTIGDGVCEGKIPLVKENLRIFNKKTGVLTAICPKCSKSQLLGKQLSKVLMDREFKEEEPSGVGDLNEPSGGEESESPDSGGDGTERERSPTPQERKKEPESEPIFPSSSFADRVIKTLDIFGIRGAKYKDKLAVLTDFVKTVPMYQTPQGLHGLLATLGFDIQLIPLVITRIFGSIDGNPAQQGMGYPVFPGQFPGQAQFPYQNPQMGSGAGMPIIHQLPNGQIIVIPQTPNPQPIIQSAPARVERGEGETSMEEVLDKDGCVAKRIYRGAGAKQPAPDTGDTLLKALITFRELGIIGTGAGKGGDPDTQIALLTQRIESKFNEVRSELSASSRRDPEIDELRRQLEEERAARDKDKQDQMMNTIGDLRHEVAAVRQGMASRRDTGSSDRGLSDYQFELDTRRKTFETLSDTVENVGLKLVDPLIEMNKNQAKLNTMLMIRTMEQQDGVQAGTYMGVMTPPQTPADAEVRKTVDKWKNRAAQATPNPPPASKKQDTGEAGATTS